MNPMPDEDAIEDQWVSLDLCFDCGMDTLHNFILFKDEPVVESECTACLNIREHPDRIR